MQIESTLPLSILIVDDSEYKIEKVRTFLTKTVPTALLAIANDYISAQKKIESEKYDLLLLDMQFPIRIGEGESLENGGEMLLDELEFEEKYIHPTRIIAFTEYEHLRKDIRDKYPELGAIKFDLTSNKWELFLERTLKSLSKSKNTGKKVIYCEGDNVKYYNMISLLGVEFWSLLDSRAIYFAAKNETDKYALRDRDFLTTNEIKKLTNEPFYTNYIILDYYCFENYIYHPDNLEEVISDFNKSEYIEELVKQKNNKLDAIIQDYKLSRIGYTDFTDNERKNMDTNPEEEIVSSLKSNNLEDFYKFFDMAGKKDKKNKKSFNKEYLAKYNLTVKQLVVTDWFNSQFKKVLTKAL